MPYMKNGKRDYAREYDLYHKDAEQKKNRAKRNAARREYEKDNGDVPRNKDIDHKRPLSKGGGNGKGNLRAVSQKTNRSYRRNKDGSMK